MRTKSILVENTIQTSKSVIVIVISTSSEIPINCTNLVNIEVFKEQIYICIHTHIYTHIYYHLYTLLICNIYAIDYF